MDLLKLFVSVPGLILRSRRSITFAMSFITSSVILSACGSSGGSDDPVLTPLDQLNVAIGELTDRYPSNNYTDFSAIPITGDFDYAGYMLVTLATQTDNITDKLAGKVSINVNFADPLMVTGTAYDFLDENSDPLTGTLPITGGTLNRLGNPTVDATFVFDGSGQLTDVGGNVINVGTQFAGDFLGATGDGIGGEVLGNASVLGVTQSVVGFFILERQSP